MDISPTKLSQDTGISLSFASMLLAGKRQPSLGKALMIYDTTGLKFGLLANLTPREIDKLRAHQEAA